MSAMPDPAMRQAIPLIRDIPQPKQTLVAGEAAEGQGVFFGGVGRGPLKLATIKELCFVAELPLDWAPSPKDPSVQLSAAIRKVASNQFTAECVKKRNQRAPEERAWATRWLLLSRAPESDDVPLAVGQKYSGIVLMASIYETRGEGEDADGKPTKIYTLEIDSQDPALAAQVRAEYDTLIGDQIFAATHVTQWLNGVLRDRMDAVKYGPAWYVPRRSRTLAVNITQVFAPVWGINWFNPPVPVQTGAELSQGIAIGLQGEVDDVLHDLSKMRDTAKKNGKTDIGHLGAEGVMGRLRTVGERVVGFEDLLGEAYVKECRNRLHDAMIELDGILGAHDFSLEWENIVKSRQQREADVAMATALVAWMKAIRVYAGEMIDLLVAQGVRKAPKVFDNNYAWGNVYGSGEGLE